MIREAAIKFLQLVIPSPLRSFLFPNATWTGGRRFVTIEDRIAGKPIRMYLREDSMMERQFLKYGLYGEWEKESLKLWSALAAESRVVVDIGANTGVFSLVAKNRNAAARVVAIEPISENFDVLTRNCRENNFDIRPLNVALSDKSGKAEMHMLKDRLNYMTSVKGNLYADFPEIQGRNEVVKVEVDTRPFSWVIETCELATVDLVKIDVEGHELAVVQSMMPAIRQFRPTILIEVIGDDTARGLEELLKGLDYGYVCIDEVGKPKTTDRLWDNDRHNFLLAQTSVIEMLRGKGLIE